MHLPPVRSLIASLVGFLIATNASAQTNLGVIIRHAPSFNGPGRIEGSAQQFLGEQTVFNSSFTLTGDMYLPGTPSIVTNGSPIWSGVVVGSGSAAPSGYQVILNGGVSLRYLRTRINAGTLPIVPAPPAPTGTRSVTINAPGQSIGDPATLRNLTLNGSVGQTYVPPGTYGNFIANGGSGFTLGIANTTTVYNLQNLTLNGSTTFLLNGPVILTIANGFTANGLLGTTNHSSWLQLQLSSGGLTLNSGCTVHGRVVAPAGTVVINGSSVLVGTLASDRLTINSNGKIIVGGDAAVNQPPVANAQSVTLAEDTTTNLTLTASDPENASLTYVVLTPPTRGTLTGTAPNLVYRPNTNANGADSFTFKVNDGAQDSAVATVSLSITPVNDAPVALPQSLSTAEDTVAPVTLAGTDVEGSALTFSIVTFPQHGSLQGTPPNLTYVPTNNFNGADTFTFKVNDGSLNSSPATISITVVPMNDAPVADTQTVTTDEDTAKVIVLTGEDPDFDSLTYIVVTPPAHGTLTGSGPNRTYLPATNYFGTDSFTFKVSDGSSNSAPTNVTITVRAINDAPITTNLSFTLLEDNATNLVLIASDVDSTNLSYTIVWQPNHGTVTPSGSSFIYSPAANYFGYDSFTFAASDGSLTSAVATVSLTIMPVNDTPVADAKNVTTDEDTPKTITLTGSDVDGDTLTFSVTDGPAHGVLSGTPPNMTYTPTNNYNGADAFNYIASDAYTSSSPATITITIAPVNDAPVPTPGSVTTDEDVPVAFTLTATDVENDPLTFQIISVPAHGTLTGLAPNLTYTPAQDFYGSDPFTFTVSDGTNTSSPATFNVTVLPVNDAPVATAQMLTTPEDTALALTLSGTDVEGDTLTFALATFPAHGTLSGTTPNFIYTPATNYNGNDSFTFRANDGHTNSAPATITINVTPQNDVPLANNQSVTNDEDTALAITLTGSDVDGDALTFLPGLPQHGTLSGTAPNLTYHSATNYFGSDSFTFRVTDGVATSAVATVSITVRPINDAPTATNISVVTLEDVPVEIPLSGADVEGDALTFTIVQPPTNGVVQLITNRWIYTPNTNFNGADTFTFKARDAALDSAEATASILVSAVNDAPSFAAGTNVIVLEDTGAQNITAWAQNISAGPADEAAQALTFLVTNDNASLFSVAPFVAADGTLTFRPAANAFGVANISVQLRDDGGTNSGGVDISAAQSFTITVLPMNDAPSFVKGADQSVNEDAGVQTVLGWATTISAGPANESAQMLNFILSNNNGSLFAAPPAISSAGALSYTPASNASGVAIVTVRLHDDGGTDDGGIDLSAAQTFTITINAVNDAPVVSAPSAVSLNEDSAFAFTGTNTISVADVDAASGAISVSLFSTNGLLTVGTTNGIEFSTGANGMTNLAISGIIGDVNAALASLIYTPANNFNGADVITVTANDQGNTGSGGALADTKAIAITVGAVNDTPVADIQNLTVNEDTALSITLTGSDTEGSALTYTIVAPPAHGALSGTAPNLTYLPGTNYNGADSFTFKANDGELDSAPATVSITVLPINDAPFATNQSFTTDEDVPVTIVLTGSDVEGGALTFAVMTGPVHGTLSGTPPNVNYLPATNYNGADSFTFKVSDGQLDSAPATVSITINPVNDAPLANDQTLNVNEDSALAITLTASDVDGDTLSYSIVSGPSHGTLSGTPPNVSYLPGTNYNGADSFTFKANDGALYSVATIFITINPVNDAPLASAQDVALDEDTFASITLTGSDVEGSVLTFSIVAPPPHGTLSGTAPNVVYQPATNFYGADSFTFKVSDGQLESAAATIAITVAPINDVPFANSQDVRTNEDVALAIMLTGSDVEGSTLNYSIVSAPTNGTLSGIPPNVSYLANTNFNGTDSFSFIVNDGVLDSQPATVSIIIDPINDAPFADNQSLSVNEDSALAVTLTGNDVEGSSLTFAIFAGPTHGTLIGTPPNVTYLPAANYFGGDSFTFKANDGALDSAAATVSIAILSINDAPTANSQSVTNAEDTALAITLTGSDVEGSALTFTVVTPPAHGALSGTAPNLIYLPATNYFGPDEFTFNANDGDLASPAATVTITITPVNDAPVANNQSVTNDENTALAITLTGSDVDGDALTFLPGTPQHGTLSGTSPTFIYTPAMNYAGPDSLVFRANDGTTNSAPATVNITVQPVNHAPVVNAGADQTNAFPNVVQLSGTVSDDGHPSGLLTFAWTQASGPGTVTFGDASVSNTTATFSQQGTYVLRLTASDSVLTSFDEVVVTTLQEESGDFIVEAGDDQVFVGPAPTVVQGQLTISEIIPGATTNIQWTALNGSDTISFADANSLSTAVTFAQAGTYQLQLEVIYGGGRRTDRLTVTVLPRNATGLTSARSSRGTDFWVTFMNNYPLWGEPVYAGMSLVIASDVDTSGIVQFRRNGFDETLPFSVRAGETTVVSIEDYGADPNLAHSDTIQSNAIHITAASEVAVYGLNYQYGTTDGFLAIPTSLLGTEYRVLSYPNDDTGNGTQFALAATEEQTTVTIVPTATTGARVAGVPYQVTLNRGETYRLINEYDPGADLTGTLVTSDKPIAVFSGNTCANVPAGIAYCDHLTEQLPPLTVWGRNFVAMPLATRLHGDRYRVLASVDGTLITTNGQFAARLNAGEVIEFLIEGPVQILSSQPALAAQFANGTALDHVVGDPFMMLLPPSDQFGGHYVLTTPQIYKYWEGQYLDPYVSYLNVVALAEGAGAIQLDGTNLPASLFVPVGNAGFVGAQIPVGPGTHTLNSLVPFGTALYGWAVDESYAYLGGIYSESVEADTRLALSQASPFQAVGTEKIAIARVTNGRQKLLPDHEITFAVTGANTLERRVRTNPFGEATLAYVSTNAGEDIIQATLVGLQQKVTNTWIEITTNRPPEVFAGLDRLVTYGEPTTLEAVISDDGIPGVGLSVAWRTLSGPAAARFADPASASTAVFFDFPGIYELEVSVNDSQFSARSLLRVIVNERPQIVQFGFYPDYGPVEVGQSVDFFGFIRDTDGTVAQANLYLDGTNYTTLTLDSRGTFQFTWTIPQAGLFEFFLEGVDDRGSVVRSYTVQVQGISTPTIVVLTPTEGQTVIAGTPVEITSDARDVDGTVVVTYGVFDYATYGFEDLGQGTGTNFAVQWTPSHVGFHQIYAYATDNDGNVGYSLVGVNALAPPPQVTIASPTNGATVDIKERVLVLIDLINPGNTVTNIEFEIDSVAQTNALFSTLAWIPTQLGAHTLQAFATDIYGNRVASPLSQVTVAEFLPPSALLLEPTNGARFANGAAVLLRATGADADGMLTNLSLLLDGVFVAETNVDALEFTATNLAGWHSASAFAVDDTGRMTMSPEARFFVERPEDTGLPTPQQLAADGVSANQIQLGWMPVPTNSGAVGVIVERWNASNSLWIEISDEAVPGNDYLDSGLQPQTAYRYRVASVDLAGHRSAYSAEAQGTTRTVVQNYAVIDVTEAVTASLKAQRPVSNILTNGGLPNFDKRRTIPASDSRIDAALGANAAAVKKAAARFKERWPQIQLDYDPLLLAPKSIMPRTGFLTGPGGSGVTVAEATAQLFDPSDPDRPVKAFLREHQTLFGFDEAALQEAQVQKSYAAALTGLRTVVWQQQVAGVPVYNGLLIGHTTAAGELASLSSQFIPAPGAAVDPAMLAALQAGDELPLPGPNALMCAVTNVGEIFALGDVAVTSGPEGAVRKQTFTATAGIKGEAHAELTWFPSSRTELRLCWQVLFTSPWHNEMYLAVVDAGSGEVLLRRSLTTSDATYAVFQGRSPAPMTPGWPVPYSGQAPVVGRTFPSLFALDPTASPIGWNYETDNETRGNNADAFLDRNDDDIPDSPHVASQVWGNFYFDLDLSAAPRTYGEASTVQLFYWNNWLHDTLYAFGFTEAAGNFQSDNFGRGGNAGDAVMAQAQDGIDLHDQQHANNANMSTPPDGYAPRMQMYVFDGAEPDRDGALDAEIIFHEYSHGLSGRLIGGGAGIEAIATAGMGEGWSDFYAMALLAQPGDDVDGVYPMGSYVTHHAFGTTLEENYYYGIRRYPYCTDTNKNPLTFRDIDPLEARPHADVPRNPVHGSFRPAMAGEVHYQGEVWCAMLWDVRANLIRKYGSTDGNSLAVQLVTDGLKLSPPNPNFVQARDAILLADRVFSGGTNQTEIWSAFARRGLGFGAKAPESYTTRGVQESNDLMPALAVERSELTGGNDDGAIDPAEDNNLTLFVRNQGDGTATHVTATLSSTTPGVTVLQNTAAYPDIERGVSSANAVALQLRTAVDFEAGTPIDLTLVVTSDQTTITNYLRLFSGVPGGQILTDNYGALADTTPASSAPANLSVLDLKNLEPLWMAEDGTSLLKVRDHAYVLWSPTLPAFEMNNPNFTAHRLTRDGVVVGRLELSNAYDLFGLQHPRSAGAKWIRGASAPEPLTQPDRYYRFPAGATIETNVGSIYQLHNTASGQPEFQGFVTNYPTIHDVWDLNASGKAVGGVSVYVRPLDADADAVIDQTELEFSVAEYHQYTGVGALNWLTVGERGALSGYSGDAEWGVNHNALLTTAAQFDAPDGQNWRWLGPLNFTRGYSDVAIALLVNSGGAIAGYGAVSTGNPEADAYAPTHAFRAPATGQFGDGETILPNNAPPILIDLGALPGGLYSFPRAMNQSGELAGNSDYDSITANGVIPPSINYHGVYWAAGAATPEDLGALGARPGEFTGYSDAYGINDSAQIVGTSFRVADGASAGVFWQRNQNLGGGAPTWEITDLNKRLTDTNWYVRRAVGINNDQWILARGDKPILDNDGRLIGHEPIPHAMLLVPLRLVPDVLPVNSDFDERKFGPLGLLVGDNEDADPRDVDGNIPAKIWEDYFVPTLGTFFREKLAPDASVVITKNVNRFDTRISDKEEGRIRIIAIRESDNAWIEVPLGENIAPEFLRTGGTYADYTKWYVEGEHQGHITLNIEYSNVAGTFVMEQRGLVATHKKRNKWRDEIYDQILLQSRVNMRAFQPFAGEFAANQRQVIALYTYYQTLFEKHPTEFLWAGMAKLAGAPIYAGLLDAEVGRTFPGVGVTADGMLYIKQFQNIMMGGAFTIFDDLAWQHRAFEASGVYALDYVAAHEPDSSAGVSPVDLNAWNLMDSGARFNRPVDIGSATSILLEREQREIIQTTYEQLLALPLAGIWNYESLISRLAKNPIPGGPTFQEFHAGRSLGNVEERWEWISDSTKGMIPIWTGTVAAPNGYSYGPINYPVVRWDWVTRGLTIQSREYRILPPMFW